jgi:type I restriction enzyme R subunit
MNKKSLTEADIRTKFITPAIVGTDDEKWNVMTQIREEGRGDEAEGCRCGNP